MIHWSYNGGRGVASYPFWVATTATETDYPFAAGGSRHTVVTFGVPTPHQPAGQAPQEAQAQAPQAPQAEVMARLRGEHQEPWPRWRYVPARPLVEPPQAPVAVEAYDERLVDEEPDAESALVPRIARLQGGSRGRSRRLDLPAARTDADALAAACSWWSRSGTSRSAGSCTS